MGIQAAESTRNRGEHRSRGRNFLCRPLRCAMALLEMTTKPGPLQVQEFIRNQRYTDRLATRVHQGVLPAIVCALVILSGSGGSAANENQATTGLPVLDNRFAPRLEQCPFKRWTPINAVKEFYGLTDDPIEEPSPLARLPHHWRSPYMGSTYYY